MRIVHVITRMIVGGAQENTLYNCLDLVRIHRDEVVLLTGPTEGAEGKLLHMNEVADLEVRSVASLIRNIQPAADFKAYRELKRILQELKPDVVHTHSAKGGFLGRAAAWNCQVPCVIHTVHGAPFHPYQNALSRWLFQQAERWAAKRCHKMICVANAMTDLMVNAHVAPREMFTTIYSGMDVDPFLKADEHRAAMRRELGFREDDVVFGKIARLFHLKGHEYLIEAVQEVASQCPNAKFLFVGDGVLREALQSQIERHGLKDRFVFTGLVPPARIPEYLSAMDALVHTSLREGLARALPQALLSGKPVISYDIDGAREVVLPGETGFLLPPKSIDALGDAIVRLASDPAMRQRYGDAGRLRCTEMFRHETMTNLIRKEYEQVLAKSSRK